MTSTAQILTAIQRGPCTYCGGYHDHTCPRIESIEYHQNGTVKKVTLRPVELTHGFAREFGTVPEDPEGQA